MPVLIGPVSFLLLSKPAEGVRATSTPRPDRAAGRGLRRGDRAARRAGRDLGAVRRAVLRRGPLGAGARRAPARLRGALQGPRAPADPGQDLLRPRRRRLRRASRPADRGRRPGLHRRRPRGPLDPDVHEHGGRHNVEFIASQEGLDDQWLFAGIVDGRNVWINDLEHSLDAARRACRRARAQLVVSTSCSLLHTPIDLDAEPAGSTPTSTTRCARWMAFAVQKVGEVATLAKGLAEGREAIADRARRERPRARVQARLARAPGTPRCARGIDGARRGRTTSAPSPFEQRREAQRARLDLPLFPTTTIGSYPADRRDPPDPRRAAQGRDRLGRLQGARCKGEIERVIRFQEDIGLDVLVHGEPERNDMVQYFGEQMDGYVFTENAWVQSYGSRYVRPPIIFGDVLRPVGDDRRLDQLRPVAHRQAGQGDAHRAGDDAQVVIRPRRPAALAETCKQLALAIRDEVADLETAGIDDHPGRRARDPRGPAAAHGPLGRVPELGGLLLPPGHRGRQGRDPDPDAHVLLGVRRHHASRSRRWTPTCC